MTDIRIRYKDQHKTIADIERITRQDIAFFTQAAAYGDVLY
jgi:hypothetical protein